MAVMLNGRVSASWSPRAVKSTLRGMSPAGLWWLKHRSATVATNLVENGFGAACACSAMAYLLAVMAAAFQRPSTRPDADVLGFDGRFCCRSIFPLVRCLPLCSLLLSWTAALATLVTAAAQIRLACSHAPRLLDISLMTDGCRCGPPTSTRDINHLHTESTITGVAFGLA